MEPKYAQDRLDPADISVTLNTYTHVLPDKAQRAPIMIASYITYSFS